jgi:hypothetical protein
MTDPSGNTPNIMEEIFTKSNVVLLLWFLAIYIVLSFIVGILSSPSTGTQDRLLSITRMFDFLVLSAILIALILGYFLKSEKDKQVVIKDGYDSFMDYIDHPASLFSVALFILALYIVILIIGIPMDRIHKPIVITLAESGAWILFVIILIASFFKYILKISIADFLEKPMDDIWNKPDPSGNRVDPSGNTPEKPPMDTDEVFNISNNIYTYADAKSICKSFDSRLATYDEIEDAYTGGGEWCNYGWSEDQSIYFPTQKETWNKLQQDPRTKNSCGRPGINGGFIDNPDARFGVNCYGKKPRPSDAEIAQMNARRNSPAPKTPEEEILDLKVKMFKDYRDELLPLNGFNPRKWSEF